MLLFYILQNNYLNNWIFLTSLPYIISERHIKWHYYCSHITFACPPFCYYRIMIFIKCEVAVACDGAMYISSFMKINQMIQKLKETGDHTHIGRLKVEENHQFDVLLFHLFFLFFDYIHFYSVPNLLFH